MNRRLPSLIVWYLAGLIVLFAVVPLSAQESLNLARDLYAAAAYEDALDVLNQLQSRDRATGGSGSLAQVNDDNRIIEEFRAFCLLALGRMSEAERAIESVVAAAPAYVPSPADFSPRVRAAFADVRRRMLPTIVQQKYAQAKAAFDRKEFASAAVEFQQVLDAFADPDLKSAANQSPLSDLRTLSAGFHELSVAAAPPPPPPPAPEPAPDPPLEAPAAPLVARIYSTEDTSVVPPATVRQTLPPFAGPNYATRRGILEVIIDERGQVESAIMRQPLTSRYDSVVLAATKSWRYRPATLDGEPVKFRKLIQIALDVQR